MKALILAAGRGIRIRKISQGQNKCMLRVGAKPLIEYSLDCASSRSIMEIIIVVGYRAQEIIDTYGNQYKSRKIRYVFQREQKGLVHAIECAKEAIGKEDFMLMLGDELLINPKHEEMISIFRKERLLGVCGVVEVQDKNLIKKTYSVIESKANKIYRLIEKPRKPVNNIMGTGNCIFKNKILGYTILTPINQKRGERELPDLIQCAIDDGNTVKSFNICHHYVNINHPKEIRRAQSYFAHL